MQNKYESHKNSAADFDFLQKMIIIGDSGVGKSNIMLRFSSGQFYQNHYATIGLNYVFKIIPLDDMKIKLQIWDTAGQDKFKTITKSYYRNAQGVLVVFGVDCRDSYFSVQKWMEDLSQTTSEKTCVILVGNKKDLTDRRQVSQEQAKALADRYGVQYMQCSAKTGQNINQTFELICRLMKKQFIDSCDIAEVKEKTKGKKFKIYHTSLIKDKCCEK